MSIVIAYANMNRVIIKCDGRECDVTTNKVVSEDTLKIWEVGKNCLIGYTGIKQYCEKAIELFEQEIKMKNPLLCIKVFQKILQILYNFQPFKAYFIITGNFNGRIVLWHLSSDDIFKNIGDKSPSIEKPNTYVVIGSDEISQAIYFEHIYDNKLTPENNMNNYIRYISTISQSVNDHITTKKIRI